MSGTDGASAKGDFATIGEDTLMEDGSRTFEEVLPDLKFDANGLIPCVVQDAKTLEVLMVAWMSEDSLKRTVDLGETVFWSRSRQELWHKGETSGNVQRVIELRYDCDGDTLIALVEPAGPACHTGERTCFYRSIELP